MTTVKPRHVPAAHPTFTNAHAQMCAVITALTGHFGDDAESLIRATYRALGHRTGQQMIDAGIVPAGADLETYGRVSEQIMDTCGLEGWTRIPSDQSEHRTLVPGCTAYLPLFRFLGAPNNVCSLPFEWDNGCLDVINNELQVWPRRCAYRGDTDCHYVIETRADGRGTADAGTSPQQRPAAVKDEPTWTNPTAGFLALIGASAARFGQAAIDTLSPALRSLGARAGQDELDESTTAGEAAECLALRYAASGFIAAKAHAVDGEAVVDLGQNPYGPVLDQFAAHSAASELFSSYDEGWAASTGRLRTSVIKDSWTLGGQHVLALHDIT
jgi:hypothetical protein